MKNDMDYSAHHAFVGETGDACNTIHDDEYDELAERDAIMNTYFPAETTGRLNSGRSFFVPGRKMVHA